MEECLQLNTVKEYNDYMGVETASTHWSASSKEHACRTPYLTHANASAWCVIFLADLRAAITSRYGRGSTRFSGEHTGIHRSRSGVFASESRRIYLLPDRASVCFSTPTCCTACPRPPYKRLYVLFYAVNEPCISLRKIQERFRR